MGSDFSHNQPHTERISLIRFNVGAMTFSKVYHWAPADPRSPSELAGALFDFLVEMARQSSNPKRLMKSPTILASRYIAWTALRESPRNPARLNGVGVVAEDPYVHAHAVFDINCGQLGELSSMPDIRCHLRGESGDFRELHLNPFATYRSLLSSEETTV